MQAEVGVRGGRVEQGTSRCRPVHGPLTASDRGVGGDGCLIDAGLVDGPGDAIPRPEGNGGGSHESDASQELSPVHIISMGIFDGRESGQRPQPQLLLRGAVEAAQEATVQLPGTLDAPLPLGNHGGFDTKALVLMLPCQGCKRLGYLRLGQPGAEAVGLEVQASSRSSAGAPDGCVVVHIRDCMRYEKQSPSQSRGTTNRTTEGTSSWALRREPVMPIL